MLTRIRSSVANKTLLSVVGVFICSVIASIGLATYFYIVDQIRTSVSLQLEQYVRERAERESQWFLLVEQKLSDLRAEYARRYEALDERAALDRFDRYFRLNDDGTAYVRREYFDGADGDLGARLLGFSGGVDNDFPLTADRKARLVLAQEMVFQHGPGFVQAPAPAGSKASPFLNFYIETPEKDLLVYWPGTAWYPDFEGGYDIATQGDFSKIFDWKTPYADRERSWTKAYRDDVPKVWMVSFTMPVDVEGRSVAGLGVDLALSDLIGRLKDKGLDGTTNLIISKDGDLIAHEDLEDVLIRRGGSFSLRDYGDPDLASLYEQIAANPGATILDDRRSGRLIAVGRIAGPDWLLVSTYPGRLVSARAADAVEFMLGVGLAALIVSLLALRVILARSIARPLGEFLAATKSIGAGNLSPVRSALPVERRDEYGELALSFLSMAQALRSVEARYRSIVSSMAEGAVFQGVDGRIISVNPEAEKILGRSFDRLVGKTSADQGWFAIKEDGSPFPVDQYPSMMALKTGQSQFKVIIGGVLPSGERRWISVNSAPVISDLDAELLGVISTFQDITQHKLDEHELRIAATAFEEALDGMIVADADLRILRVNKAFVAVTGYAVDEVVGKTPAILRSQRHDAQFYRAMWASIREYGYWTGEVCNRRKNGDLYFEWLSITAVRDHLGQVKSYVASFSDITARKEADERNYRLAFFDTLTELPNRQLFLDRLRQSLLLAARQMNQGAVLFVDLDDFKIVNETRGYEIGDLVLQQIARRLLGEVHKDDTLARLGGDEFAIILHGLDPVQEKAAQQADDIARRIHDAIHEPIDLEGQAYHCKASIGISLFGDHGLSAEDLLNRADAAMSQAKKSGRNRVHFFDQQMQEALEAYILLESLLASAIPDQLRLHYQVQVDAEGFPFGAEALIRWQHPERGMISPGEFIPLAEETGLVIPMGDWVLEEACRQIRRWQSDDGKRHLRLSVNVSAKQLRQSDFVDKLARTLHVTGADPSRLKLELTESMLVEDMDKIVLKMRAVRALRVQLSLDDFGTGFSSLSYLKSLPLDQLKIDQSFVRNIATAPIDASIVRVIISLGHSLGVAVIAEGVETREQREFLASHGCTQYQGYLFGRPLPVEAFERLVDSLRTGPQGPSSSAARIT